MLGTDIENRLRAENADYVCTDIDTDITDIEALRDFSRGKDICCIINASGYTAVDKAESEEEKAELINGKGVGNIGSLASELGACVIHFSTDYVFSGEKTSAYTETDEPSPVSAYGRTKLSGEDLLKESTDRYFIFRISWLYGLHGPNFVKTMLRLFNERPELGIVNDQKGAPTYAGKLAENIVRLVLSGSDNYGTYHYSDEGFISWYDFACGIRELGAKKGLCPADVRLRPITTADYPTPARRPANSAFVKDKVKSLGFELNSWETNLKVYMEKLEKTQ